MPSLTPGILLKLLQSMNSDTKVAGEHRSVLLQIVGIVPTLPDPDQLCPNHGFYIQLSDSINSTYVSLSNRDNDLVLANRLQLGQFAYVDRLQFDAPPLPRASGLNPVPGRHPFVGNPEPLVARISPSKREFIIQPDPGNCGPRRVLPAKESVIVENSSGRRMLSACGRSVSVRKRGSGGAEQRDNSRPPSPVPSMVTAKEECRRSSRESVIIVPSRYRQPSPSGQKQAVSRLSGGLKASPDSASNKKVISKASDVLVGSAKNMRKSWEGSVEQKVKAVSRNKQAAIPRQLSDTHRDQSNLEDVSTNENARSSCKIECLPIMEKLNDAVQGITIHERKWTDGSFVLDGVPPNLAKLGKDALHRRSLASAAAADALDEASATESVIRNLSMFSHLCSSSSKARSPLPVMNQFLSLYEDTVKSTAIAESLAARRSSDNHREVPSPAFERLKSISLWIEAALATDLEAITLLINQTENSSNSQKPEKPVVISPPRTSISSKRHSFTTPAKKHPKVPLPSDSVTWVRGHGVGETAELARNLKREMQVWFLGFVEEAVDAGFLALGENSVKENGQVAALLSQLKWINEWLDGVGRNREEGSTEKIEWLKQKIYRFVMQNVGAAIDGLNSNATA